MTLSYLVATAGHAQAQNEKNPHDIRSIIQLVEEGAAEFDQEKVVGFTLKTNEGWQCDRYCVFALSSFACHLSRGGQPRDHTLILSVL